jgi:hypothetical protein
MRKDIVALSDYFFDVATKLPDEIADRFDINIWIGCYQYR